MKDKQNEYWPEDFRLTSPMSTMNMNLAPGYYSYMGNTGDSAEYVCHETGEVLELTRDDITSITIEEPSIGDVDVAEEVTPMIGEENFSLDADLELGDDKSLLQAGEYTFIEPNDGENYVFYHSDSDQHVTLDSSDRKALACGVIEDTKDKNTHTCSMDWPRIMVANFDIPVGNTTLPTGEYVRQGCVFDGATGEELGIYSNMKNGTEVHLTEADLALLMNNTNVFFDSNSFNQALRAIPLDNIGNEIYTNQELKKLYAKVFPEEAKFIVDMYNKEHGSNNTVEEMHLLDIDEEWIGLDFGQDKVLYDAIQSGEFE